MKFSWSYSRVATFLPYALIFLTLWCYWGGYIVRGKAPLATVVPGRWSHCEDMAVVTYGEYLSGHHALQGFSLWSFNESLGNNFYTHLQARYLNPFNIAGALLVDWARVSPFMVFGWVNFSLLFFAAACCFYYFKNVFDYSQWWSLAGACVYLALPLTAEAMFINYLGITAFFPACLILLDKFYKDQKLKNTVFFLCILSLPLFFGMINIYINYLLIAGLAASAYVLRVQERRERTRIALLTAAIFVSALLLNSVVWGPTLLQMLSSTGQGYALDHADPLAINPLEFAVQLLLRVLFGYPLYSFFPSWLGQFLSPKSAVCFQMLNRLGLLSLLIGIYYSFRTRRLLLARVWLVGILCYGIVYYVFQLLAAQDIIRVFDLLKFIKYQDRIAAPFLALFIIDGVRVLVGENISPRFRRIAVGVLIAIAGVALLNAAATGAFRFPWLASFLQDSGWGKRVINQAMLAQDPVYRWQIFADAGRFVSRWNLACIIFVSLLLAVKLIMRFRVRFLNVAIVVGIIFSIGYYAFMYYGGFIVRNEVYAEDYFVAQKNEAMVKQSLAQDSYQYRALYFDDLDFLQKKFPTSDIYRNVSVPPENKGARFEYDTRKYMNRADALGIPITDGWLVFPSKAKKDFFGAGHGFCEPFPFMSGLTWNVNNPFDEHVAQTLNVKYVVSHYPLPGFRLINQTSEYWGYLYALDNALPICSIIGQQGGVASFRLSPDRIDLQSDSRKGGMVRLNMTLDTYWKAMVNGKPCKIATLDSMFAGVSVPAGRSQVVFWYDYWPLKFFFLLSVGGVFLFIYLYRLLAQMAHTRLSDKAGCRVSPR